MYIWAISQVFLKNIFLVDVFFTARTKSSAPLLKTAGGPCFFFGCVVSDWVNRSLPSGNLT